MEYKHEVEDTMKGLRHRITSGKGTKCGEWVGYTCPATMPCKDGVIVGVTDFYKGSVDFPDPEKLYIIKELK